MSGIKINTDTQYTNASRLQQTTDRLRQMSEELFRSYYSLDWEIRRSQELSNRAYGAVQDAKTLAGLVEQMGNYLKTAAIKFEESDAQKGSTIGNISALSQPYIPACSNPVRGIVVPSFTSLFAGIAGAAMVPITTGLGWIREIISGPKVETPAPKEPVAGYIPKEWLQTSPKGNAVSKAGAVQSADQAATAQKPATSDASNAVWPVPGGKFDPKNGFGVKRSGISTDLPNGHGGIDIWPTKAGVPGDAVLAPFSGQKAFAGNAGTNGNAVYYNLQIDGINYQVRFAHLNKISQAILDMKNGQLINPTQQIGEMGFTGACVPANADGTHLHLEVRVSKDGNPCNIKSGSPSNSMPINPITFFKDKLKMKI